MRRVVSVVCIVCLMMVVFSVGAQEATPEMTDDTGAELTAEAPTEMGTEMPAEPTTDAGAEMTTEATPGAGGEADQGTGAGSPIVVRDQISLNGMVMIDSVTSDVAGFVAIHATDMNGGNPHVVGAMPVQPGTTEGLEVMIDGAMATPFLTAQLHIDDTTPGVFEYGKVEGADMPVTTADGGMAAAQPFKIAAIVAFDQQPLNNTVVIASVISEVGGWLVIHADEGGQIGGVLGQAALMPGTNPAVMVTMSANGLTSPVWAVLHADDGTVGTFEFDPASGNEADLPLQLDEVTAAKPINLTDTPTLMLADGRLLDSDVIPAVITSQQTFDGDASAGVNFVVDNVISVGPGFVDVHADGGGHPSTSLGVSPVPDGESSGVTVALMPMMGMPITPTVWPMLHQDTNANGIYEYLMIPGEDLPVVYNGGVVTIPVGLGGSAIDSSVPGGDMGMTPEATTDTGGGIDTTVEATTDTGAGAEMTAEVPDEMTVEATTDTGTDATVEPSADLTPEPGTDATAAP